MSFFKMVSDRFNRMSSGEATVDSVITAYREGDYQSALKKCEAMQKDSQRYFHWKGIVLHKLGKLAESEAVLRQGAEAKQESEKQMSLIHEALGSTLSDLGRLDEAIASFEKSIRCGPERSSRYRALSGALLESGGDLPSALHKAQVAARIAYSDSVDNPDPEKMDLCEAVSTLAWAVAANSKDEWEIEKLDRETSALCNPKNKPSIALMHYSMGRAYAELGKAKLSANHFEKAAAAEPQGNFGRLSKAALG